MDNVVLICVIVMAAAFIHSFAGFGFSIIAMALLPMLMSVIDSMMLLIFANLVTVAYITVKYFRYINFRLLIVPVVLSLAGNYVGLSCLVGFDNAFAIKILGSALVLLSAYFFFFSKKIKIPDNQIFASIAGAASGLMSGFFSIPGPPIVLYYSAATKQKEEYLSTLQMFFLVNTIFKIIFFVLSYKIKMDILCTIPFVVVSAGIGVLFGNVVFKKTSLGILKKIIYLVMTISGIWYIVS